MDNENKLEFAIYQNQNSFHEYIDQESIMYQLST